MQFIRIAKVSDFDKIRCRSYTVLARKVGVFKEPDGSFYAIEAACKHQNADLTTGAIRGDVATCPRHGWQYNLRTGACLNQDSAPLRRYGCKVENGDIYITLLPIED